jgi:hypothetical protein
LSLLEDSSDWFRQDVTCPIDTNIYTKGFEDFCYFGCVLLVKRRPTTPIFDTSRT